MSNTTINYFKESYDQTLDQQPLNIVDIAILSQLPLLDFIDLLNDGPKTIKDLAIKYFESNDIQNLKLGLIIPQTIIKIFELMKDSPRYQDLLVTNFQKIFDEENEEQFAGMTIKDSSDHLYVIFCATDDTLVAWKENFNLLNLEIVPAQSAALNYLMTEANNNTNNQITVCGHSKGGNLAMYAGVFATEEVFNRIDKIYNLDGPGFRDHILNDPLYQQRKDHIQTIIPSGSVVGLLLEHQEPVRIIKSCELYLYQHDILSWYVENNDFVSTSKLSNKAIGVDKKVKAMLKDMSDQDKLILIESTYQWLTIYKSKTLTDLFQIIPRLFSAFFTIDKKRRKVIAKIMYELMKDQNIRVTSYHSIIRFKRYLRRQKQLLKEFDQYQNTLNK